MRAMRPQRAQDWELARHQEAAETGTSGASAQQLLPSFRHCHEEELHARPPQTAVHPLRTEGRSQRSQ